MVYDRKGYGGADHFNGKWACDYLITESSVYLPQLLTACDLMDVLLVGHSDGGSIVLLAAALQNTIPVETRPRIRGGITEAAHIFIEAETISGIRKAVKAYESTGLKKRLVKYHGDNTDRVFRRWSDTWLDPAFRDWNMEHFLADIRCPLLVIQGEDDEYATRAQVTGIAKQASGPVQVAMIPNCGHIPHFQARSATLDLMTRFVDQLAGSRGDG
jgi:pimeloyl-ACP methyl ester carboxylesterase